MIKCLRGLCRVQALALSAYLLEAMLDMVNDGDNWEVELPFKYPLHHLKAVEMWNLQGCENELMFLSYCCCRVCTSEVNRLSYNSMSNSRHAGNKVFCHFLLSAINLLVAILTIICGGAHCNEA